MSEWQSVETSVYDLDFQMELGPLTLRARWLKSVNQWSVDFGGTVHYKILEALQTPETAKNSALAWARQVLGAALVEAGADALESFMCDDCGVACPVPGPCNICDKALSPVKYARID